MLWRISCKELDSQGEKIYRIRSLRFLQNGATGKPGCSILRVRSFIVSVRSAFSRIQKRGGES